MGDASYWDADGRRYPSQSLRDAPPITLARPRRRRSIPRLVFALFRA